MNIIISTTSMTPIYEQIVESIKHMILSGELTENEPLPSVRVLSRDLKISALTVKKAYDHLEEEGLTRTIHGKGTFVSEVSPDLVAEKQRQEVEQDMEKVVLKAKVYAISPEELRQILELYLSEA